FVADHLELFCCPRCGGALRCADMGFACATCSARYEISAGIPRFFAANRWDASEDDVTDEIRRFYEETPFPNYDDFDDVASLVRKARQGIFARLLDEQVPYRARVLEAGCGTGQLTNFLSVANRLVIGA